MPAGHAEYSDEAIEELSEAVEKRRWGPNAENGPTGPNDLELHYRIVQACGNERLIELLCNDLYYAILFQRHLLAPEPGHASEGYREHREILEAMRERDTDRAENLMRRACPAFRRTAQCTASPVRS